MGQVLLLYGRSREEVMRNCDCSIHECSNEMITDVCENELETDQYVCGKSCYGRRLDYNKTVILTPRSMDLGNLTLEEKISICSFTQITKIMKEKKYFDGSSKKSVYLGLENGIFRIWPGTARNRTPDGDPNLDRCRYYDPRLRPWYGPAATGPKNIIIVIENSAFMNENRKGRNISKWNAVVEAVRSMIKSFVPSDFFNVVTFAKDAEEIWKEIPLRNATEKHKEEAIKLISQRNSSVEESFYIKAFNKAFDLLIDGCRNKSCSQCKNTQDGPKSISESIIVFVTERKDTSKDPESNLKYSEIAEVIRKRQKEFNGVAERRVSIFTYSLGETADHKILKQIACENDGAWFLIKDGDKDGKDQDDIFSILRKYFIFYALRKPEDSPQPVWIKPYPDDITGRKVTTVSIPVYYPAFEEGEKKDYEFLGVLGHDVFLSDFENTQSSKEKIKERLNEPKCDPPFGRRDLMQALRKRYANEFVCVSRLKGNIINENEGRCFTDGQMFYKTDLTPMTQEKANSSCAENGGQLVSIGTDDKKLEFVATYLADEDGSWIGLRNQNNVYVWVNKTLENITADSKFWDAGQLGEYGGCVAIYPSGVNHNLVVENCDQRTFSFICEYKNAKSCGEDVINPLEEFSKGNFSIPPIDRSLHEDISYSDELIAEANALDSWQVICPFRKSITDAERICCDECNTKKSYSEPSETSTNSSDSTENDKLWKVVIALAVSVGVLAVILWLIVQAWLISHFQRRKGTDDNGMIELEDTLTSRIPMTSPEHNTL